MEECLVANKKHVLIICIAVMLILAGCSGKNGGNNQNAAPSNDTAGTGEATNTGGDNAPAKSDVTLTMSRWAGPHADDQAELLKEFTAETGIKVKMDAIDYAQLKQKQTLNMSGKTGQYDLVWVQEIWMSEYAKAGYLLPLDDMIKDTALAGDDFDLPDFNPNFIKIDTIDGKLYALPTFPQAPIMVYNTEMLAKEGLQPPKTTDEVLKVAKALHDKGTGIAIPARQGLAAVDTFHSLMRSNGGNYFSSDGKLDLTTEPNIAAAQYWKDLSAVAMKGSTTWHWDEVNKALQFGQAPIGFSISGLLSFLEDPAQSKVAGKVGYAPLPYFNNPFGTVSFWSWAVAADSKHPKEAFQLAAWLTSKSTEKKMGLINGNISARTSLFSDKELIEKAPWFAAVGEALKQSDTEPLRTGAPKLMEALQNSLSSIATTGSDPKQELEKVQKDLAPLFETE
jgi:ABC-type glycerol-3-phosphate transport system substrate-binding protein